VNIIDVILAAVLSMLLLGAGLSGITNDTNIVTAASIEQALSQLGTEITTDCIGQSPCATDANTQTIPASFGAGTPGTIDGQPTPTVGGAKFTFSADAGGFIVSADTPFPSSALRNMQVAPAASGGKASALAANTTYYLAYYSCYGGIFASTAQATTSPC